MITEAIIIGLTSVVNFVIGLLPTLPPMPTAVQSAGQWLIDQIVFSVSFFRTILSTELLTAVIIVFVAVFSYETFYHAIMWIVRKIPINVH